MHPTGDRNESSYVEKKHLARFSLLPIIIIIKQMRNAS